MVVVAAGRGVRLGNDVPKQFLPLAGAPMLLHAVRPFLSRPDVVRVVAVLPDPMASHPPEWLAQLIGERLTVVAGGQERMDSVLAGLDTLPPACSVIVVHDGARPFPDPGVIDLVIREARHGAGAIAAVPVSDTIKQAEVRTHGARQRIARTVPREGMWRAQTPQAFPRSMLEAAYADARSLDFIGTDCASLVERIGGEVVLVADVATNLKVTTPSDLELARAIAGLR